MEFREEMDKLKKERYSRGAPDSARDPAEFGRDASSKNISKTAEDPPICLIKFNCIVKRDQEGYQGRISREH